MKWTKKAGMTAIFILCVMISVLLSGCGRETASGSGTGSAEIIESASVTADPSGTETEPDASDVAEPDGEDGKENQIPEDTVQMVDSIDIPVTDSPSGSLMASDGEYIYFSYRANDEELGGLCTSFPFH